MATIQERQTKEGNISFRVQVRLKGFPTQTASFQRKTDAKRWAAQTEAAIREGRHFKTTEAKRHTLNDLIQRYIKQVLPTKPKSEYKQSRQLKWWSEQIGAYALCEITPALIADQRDRFMEGATVRGPKRSPATVNRYLAALSHALAIAVKEWGWLDNNPLSKVRKLKEPRGRVRFLSDEERQRLLQVCKESNNEMLYLIVVLCLSTGARKMEILGLHWEDVDLNRNMIVLHETKNNERRVLPLTGHAFELMQAYHNMRSFNTNLVFPNVDGSKTSDIRYHWEEAIKKANISDFRFHDLRHSAASYLAMNGATMAEIAEVLGHKTLQMVKRYAHLSEAHTASVVSKMNEKIFGGG